MTSQNTETTQITRIIGIRFNKIGKLYHFDAAEHQNSIQPGDYAIVETSRGRQMGQVICYADYEEDREYKPILRKATPRDLTLQQVWQEQEVGALITCREAASKYKEYEQVKFVAAQYNYDGSMLTFLYSTESDNKPNINRLRNDLNRTFRSTKIDLRQVGPRDVAKVLGGYGACGQPRCCSTFLTDFSPISIKMAKAQGVSLNPSEITGMCGRLRCCLIYEYEQYVEARKTLPKRNKRVGTPAGEGKVVDVLPLQDAVVVKIENERHTFNREEIMPLEEWEALQKKAAQGCDKNESGGCDCGANR